MRRILIVFMTVAMLVATLSTAALARGGHGHGRSHHQPVQKQTGYVPCTVEGCEIAHTHQHDKNWYCGQAGLAGEYEVCTVKGCAAIGLHEHDGQYYHCRTYGSGSGRQVAAEKYAICTTEGCTVAGVHEHGGTYYRCQKPAAAKSGHGRHCLQP